MATPLSWVCVHGWPGGGKDGPANLFGVLDLELRATHPALGFLTFDFGGSGTSRLAGPDVSLSTMNDDLHAVLTWLELQGDSRVVYVAESFGATVALLSRRLEPSALVLLWPAIDLQQTELAPLFEADALDAATKGRLRLETEVVGAPMVQEVQRAQPARALADVACPVLLIHGTADQLVPVEGSRLALQRLKRAATTACFIPDADHGCVRPGEQRVVCASISRWLTEGRTRDSEMAR